MLPPDNPLPSPEPVVRNPPPRPTDPAQEEYALTRADIASFIQANGKNRSMLSKWLADRNYDQQFIDRILSTLDTY